MTRLTEYFLAFLNVIHDQVYQFLLVTFVEVGKVYPLVGGFCGSPVNFHAKDGSGYKFLGEMVVQLDKINPLLASRLVSAFSRCKRYDENRQKLAKDQLEMILSSNGLPENVFEIASKSLVA